MKGKTNQKQNNQRGEVMLEAAMIMVPILILLMVLLSLSFLFYQQTMMATVASEIAADIGKNYKFTDFEVGDNTISTSDVTDLRLCRTNILGKSSMQKDKDAVAETYAKWRVGLSSFGLNPGEPEVECKLDGTGIGRLVVKVTVSQKTDFFLSDVMEFAGVSKEKLTFSATAYAECSDLMSYTSMINFTEFISDRLSMFNSIGNLYGSMKDLLQNLLD